MLIEKNIKFYVCSIKQLKILKENNISGEIGEIVDFPINLLTINSHRIVKAKCSMCGEIKEMTYQKYNVCTRNQTDEYCCNKKECINYKREKRMMEKYGVKNTFELQDTKDKMKITNLERYGCENPHQNEEVKKKAEETNLVVYGCKNVFQNEEIKEKSRQTCLEKFGTEYAIQSKDVIGTYKKNCIEKYGTEHPMQNSDVAKSNRTKAYKRKDYCDTGLHYQASYEKDFLDRYFGKLIIENGKRIEYFDKDSKKHYYHSDFYLPEYDLIVEVKSTWVYSLHEEEIILKEEYTKKLHNYIMIMNMDYTEFDKIISN